MEPRGGKRWQPVANRIGADGKEGVSGSSPEEGSAEAPQRGPAPVGRRPAFVTAQAASATRGVTSGKSITGCATRLK